MMFESMEMDYAKAVIGLGERYYAQNDDASNVHLERNLSVDWLVEQARKAMDSFDECDVVDYSDDVVDAVENSEERLFAYQRSSAATQHLLIKDVDDLGELTPGKFVVATGMDSVKEITFDKNYVHSRAQVHLLKKMRQAYDRYYFCRKQKIAISGCAMIFVRAAEFGMNEPPDGVYCYNFFTEQGIAQATVCYTFTISDADDEDTQLESAVHGEDNAEGAVGLYSVRKRGVRKPRRKLMKRLKRTRNLDARIDIPVSRTKILHVTENPSNLMFEDTRAFIDHADFVPRNTRAKKISTDVLMFPELEGSNTALINHIDGEVFITCYQIGNNTLCPLHDETGDDVVNNTPWPYLHLLGNQDCVLCGQLRFNLEFNQPSPLGLPLYQPKAQMAFGNTKYSSVSLTLSLRSDDAKHPQDTTAFQKLRNGFVKRYMALTQDIYDMHAFMHTSFKTKYCWIKTMQRRAKPGASLQDRAMDAIFSTLTLPLEIQARRMWAKGMYREVVELVKTVSVDQLKTNMLADVSFSNTIRNLDDDVFIHQMRMSGYDVALEQEEEVGGMCDSLSTWCKEHLGLTLVQSALSAASLSSVCAAILSFVVNGGALAFTSLAASIATFACVVCVLKEVDIDHLPGNLASSSEALVSLIAEVSTADVQREEGLSDCPTLVKKLVCGMIVLTVACGASVVVKFLPSVDKLLAAVNKLSMFNHHSVPFISDAMDWISSMLFGDESEGQQITNRCLDLVAKSDKLLQNIESCMFEKPWIIEDMRKTSAEILTMLSSIDKNHKMRTLLVNSRTSLQERINGAEQAIARSATRQTPVVMIFYGKEGIGKTTARSRMCEIIRRRRYDNHPGTIYDIKATSKYFKSYHGEPIVAVQEMLSTYHAEDDLIMTELTGMCSSAPYNMQAASVSGKEQMLRCHGIYIDTNAEPKEVKRELGACVKEHSIEPWLRRVLFVECTWTKDPSYLSLPRNERPFDSKKYSHLCFRIQRYKIFGGRQEFVYIPLQVLNGEHTETSFLELCNNILIEGKKITEPYASFDLLMTALRTSPATLSYLSTTTPITFDMSFDDICTVEQHQYDCEKRNFEKEQREKEVRSEEAGARKHHMVVNIHGPVGVGKTDTILKDLLLSVNSNAYFRGRTYDYGENVKPEHLNEPCIFVCDDIMVMPSAFEEKKYIQWYNTIPNNSLIVFISNYVPTVSFELRTLSYSLKRLPFTIPTFYRRAGFDGKFRMPDGSDNITTNKYCYLAEIAGIVVDEQMLASMEFSRYILLEYVKYLREGFNFSVIETPNIPSPTPEDIKFFSPSLKQFRDDINGFTKLLRCMNDMLPTKITLSRKDRMILMEKGSMFLTKPPNSNVPAELVTHYAKAIRAMGVTSNIYCEVSDIGICVVQANTIYSNVSLNSLQDNITFTATTVCLDGHELSMECAMQLVANTSLDNINANFPLMTIVQRGRIIDWLSERERKDVFVAYLREHNVDTEFEYLKRTKWDSLKDKMPWILALVAGSVALFYIIKGMIPIVDQTTVAMWARREVEAEEMGQKIAVPAAISMSPYYLQSRFDVKEEVKAVDKKTPVQRYRREKHVDTGDARDKLKQIPKGEIFRLNKEIDAHLIDYQGDNYDAYRALHFADRVRRDYGIELYREEEGYLGPALTARGDPYKEFYTTIVSRNIVKVSNASYGIAIFGRCIVVPVHVVLATQHSRGLWITTTIDDKHVDFPCELLHVMKGRDLAVLRVTDLKCPMFRDISNHFCDSVDVKSNMHVVTAIPRGGDNVVLDRGSIYRINYDPEPYSSEALVAYSDYVEVAQYDRQSGPGDCGSPYIIQRGGKCKILGIHTTGSATTTTASIITTLDMERLSEMQHLERVAVVEEVAEQVFERTVREEHNEVMKLTPSNYVKICLRTILPNKNSTPARDIFPLTGPRIMKVRNLPNDMSFVRNQKSFKPRHQYPQLVRDLGRPKKIPIISNFEELKNHVDLELDGEGRRSQIMTNVAFLQRKYDTNIDPLIRKHLVSELSSYIEHAFPHAKRFLTLDETINGVELEDGSKLRPMDMSSSSGFFVRQNLGLGCKRDAFKRVEYTKRGGEKVVHYAFADDDCANCTKEMYEYTMKQLKNGKQPPHLFTTTRKMELLKREKAHKGRVFETPNMEFTMAERTIFGALMASMSKWDPHSPICVGMNTANNFNELFSLHDRFDLHGAVDFIKWDKMVPWELVSILRDAIKTYNTDWSRAACALLETLFHSTRVIGNTVYCVTDSMPSGSATTAPLNSLINYTIDLYVFCKLVGKFPIRTISEHLLSSNYGDDKVLSWTDDIADVFDMNKYKNVVESDIGMRLDSDKKDGNILASTKNLSDLSFLSRTPRYISGVGWLGALKVESIEAGLYWAKEKCDTFDFVQHAWDEALFEAARHGPNYHAKLVSCYMNVAKNFHALRDLRPPATYGSELTKLFVGATVGVEYTLPSRRLNQREEMNSEPNMQMAHNEEQNNALARMQGSGTSTSKMVMPHMGLSQADIMLGVTPMMNNAQVVDDKNDVTAVSMNAPILEQSVPMRYRFDIWSSLFTSNIFIDRQYIGADTPIDTVVFNYSSDPASEDFPSSSAAIQFVKQLLLAHKYNVVDYRVKVKLVAATGTIGRLLVAVVPVDFTINSAAGGSISTILKGSGYDYAEISANGDSTYVASLRPYVNMGFASVSNGTGAGQLVENVRVIAVISETFGTTFSEQPPNVAVTTEFSFGEGFEMSIPLTTFPALLSVLQPAPQRQRVDAVVAANRFLVGSGQTLRVGANRAPSFTSFTQHTPTANIPELGGKLVPYLNMNDVWTTLPVQRGTGESDGSFPVFMRGSLPVAIDAYLPPNSGESFLNYLERWFTSTYDVVEVLALLNSEGEVALPITFDQVGVRQAFADRGVSLSPGTDNITENYIFRGLIVRSALTEASIFWAEFPDNPPIALGEEEAYWDQATMPGIYLNYTAGTDTPTVDVIQTGPTFLPSKLAQQNPTTADLYKKNPAEMVQFSSGGYDPVFAPEYSVSEDARIPLVIGSSVSNGTTDGTYKPLTISDARLSSLATTGTGAIPSEAHRLLIAHILSRNISASIFTQFDLITENGILIAHCGADINGNLYINIDTPFVYREFAGPIFATGFSTSSFANLLPTPSNSWQGFATQRRAGKFGSGKRMESGIVGGLLGGALSGIGGALSASQQHKYDLQEQQKQYEYQRGLNEQNYENQSGLANLQGDISSRQSEQKYGYDKNLSAQSYQQGSALSQQQFNQQVQARGLADPSQLNKPTFNNNKGGVLHSAATSQLVGVHAPLQKTATVNNRQRLPPAAPTNGQTPPQWPKKLTPQMVRARGLPMASPSRKNVVESSQPRVAYSRANDAATVRGLGGGSSTC